MNNTEQCYKCHSPATLDLSCEHQICLNCIPSSKSLHLQNVIHLCQICQSLSSVQINDNPTQISLEHILICTQCMKGPFTMQQFLEGIHRNHSVVTIKKSIKQINNQFLHQSESLSLQNQSLYRRVDNLTRQKRKLTEKYSLDTNNIKMIFHQLIQSIKQKQEKLLEKYEEYILDQCSVLDSQVNSWKQKIKMCQNYMSTIESQCKSYMPLDTITTVDFFMEHHIHISKFLEELCSTRLHNISLNVKQQEINLDEINELKKQIPKLNIFLWEQSQIQLNSSAKEDQTQNYFERKRKEIFAQTSLSTSYSTIPQRKETNPEIDNKNFNIDERLNNLRKMMNFESNPSPLKKKKYKIK